MEFFAQTRRERRAYPAVDLRPRELSLPRQSARQSPDVSRITATATTDVTNAFPSREGSEFLEFTARDLNCLKGIWKCRLPGKTMAIVRRAKSSGLRCDRDVHGRAHLAEQREHSSWLLFAVGADSNRPMVRHHLRAFAGRAAVRARDDHRDIAHGAHGR